MFTNFITHWSHRIKLDWSYSSTTNTKTGNWEMKQDKSEQLSKKTVLGKHTSWIHVNYVLLNRSHSHHVQCHPVSVKKGMTGDNHSTHSNLKSNKQKNMLWKNLHTSKTNMHPLFISSATYKMQCIVQFSNYNFESTWSLPSQAEVPLLSNKCHWPYDVCYAHGATLVIYAYMTVFHWWCFSFWRMIQPHCTSVLKWICQLW